MFEQLKLPLHLEPTGVGRVLNLRFSSSFSHVLWDPPSTAGILSDLKYHVTVKNNVLLISNTTNNTYYPITSMVQRCHEYTASVTAFSSEYHGDSVVNKEKPPGGVCVCVCVYVCVCVSTCYIYIYIYKLYAGFKVTMGVRSSWKPMYRCPKCIARGRLFRFLR